MRNPNLKELMGNTGVLRIFQKAIERILPEFAEEQLDNEEVREKIVDLADSGLVKQYPYVKLVIKEEKRKQILRRLLDIVLDDIILPD